MTSPRSSWPRFVQFAFISVLALGWAVPTYAIYPPLRDRAGLLQPREELMVRVRNSKVVLADYAAIRRDFPALSTKSEAKIDEWLLAQTSYVSRAQAQQTDVNTPIELTGEERLALRPDDYGRAVVFPVDDAGGMMDMKGSGARYPRAGDHGDGLATLGESIREFTYEKLAHEILQNEGSALTTVQNYAVLDLGFDVRHVDGSTSPAGSVLRQAHTRSLEGSFSGWGDAKALEAELIFRKYGVTSAGALRGVQIERINIQGTKENGIVDFGGFLTVEKFEKDVRNWDTPQILLHTTSTKFRQPDPALRVPFEIWGTSVSGIQDPKLDNVWIWSHELAKSLRNGTATRADAETHLRNLLEPVRARFQSYRQRLAHQAAQACLRAQGLSLTGP